jgi:hypothetical protein
MLQINVDHNTKTDELDLIGNFLVDLGKLRGATAETTKAPKKTKAQPVTLTALEPEAALPESLPTPEAVVAAPAAAAEPEHAQYTDIVSDGGLDPRNEPAATEESSPVESPLDLVGLRAAIAPIMKDKKDALVALVKEYGESLPKIDPALYPEILAKAKEL